MLRKIPGFDGYEISEDGETLISYRRIIPITMKYFTNPQGYIQAHVIRDGKHYATGVHRLVALAYVEKTDPFAIHVHHKDHNKKNNHYSNLEWVTPSKNIKYNYETGGQIPKAGIKGVFGRDNPEVNIVMQYHKEDGLVQCHWGINEAARVTNSHAGHIAGVCRGVKKTHNGFIWRYMFK